MLLPALVLDLESNGALVPEPEITLRAYCSRY